MMFSSAVMISSFSTRDFLKLSRRSKDLVGGLKAKTKCLPTGCRLRRLTADGLPCRGTLARELLDERDHLLLIRLADDLQQCRLGGDVGQPT